MNQFVVNRWALGAGLVSSLLLAFGTGCGGGSSGAPAPSAPAAASAPMVCATFYADGQLKGATLVAKAPVDDGSGRSGGLQRCDVVRCSHAGMHGHGVRGRNYGGQEVTFTQTTELVPASINDRISSYKCSCGSAGSGGK